MRYVKNKYLLLLLSIYTIISIYFLISNYVIFHNIVSPIFWLILSIYLYISIKKKNIRITENRRIFKFMVFISTAYIILLFYSGFIFGFSKSIYEHSIIAILTNIFRMIIPVIGIELSRCVLLHRNKKNKIIIFYTFIILFFLEIDLNYIVRMYANKEQLFKYICQTIIPLFSSGILYSYLTMKDSYKTPLVYRLFYSLFYILMPIVPDLNWFIVGSTGVIIPLVIYLLYKYIFIKQKNDYRIRKETTFSKVMYITSVIILITITAFMLGLFKYEVIAVLSNSMDPTYSRGDAVIYEKVPENDLYKLEKETIILYRIDDQIVAHRIVGIEKSGNKIFYITKGDNNQDNDAKVVQVSQIKGIYSFRIKYIGFPSVWLHDFFVTEKAKVDTGVDSNG